MYYSSTFNLVISGIHVLAGLIACRSSFKDLKLSFDVNGVCVWAFLALDTPYNLCRVCQTHFALTSSS